MARKRRGKGEGSLYLRKDSWWVGQYKVNGKRRYVSGKTRAEVAKKLTRAVADLHEGARGPVAFRGKGEPTWLLVV